MFRRIRDRNGVFPQDRNTVLPQDGVEEGGEAAVVVKSEEPPVNVDSPLARAWFEKRKQQLRAQPRTKNATAVDVDSVALWNNDAKNKKTRIKPNDNDNDSYLEGASALSIVTDRTPVVSNQRPGLKRKPTERSMLPSFATGMTSTTGELSCGDVFDVTKWHGKVLYGLIILLVLSIITVIATAFLSGKNFPAEEVGELGSPSDGDSLTAAPYPMIPIPPVAPANQAVVLTSTPPRNEIIEPPSPAPVSPVLPLSIVRTAPPTSQPRTAPAPIARTPTTAPPTAAPTSSPTVSLAGLVGSLKETYRVNTNSRTVTLSGDGKVMAVVDSKIVGSHNVTVYQWDDDNGWAFRSVNRVGETPEVSLNHDGTIMAISAPFESVPVETSAQDLKSAGRVQVFLYDFSLSYRPLGQQLHGKTEGAYFGHSLALSHSGTTIAIGAPSFVAAANADSKGEVQVFEFSSTRFRWDPVGSPLVGAETEDWFGNAISIIDVPLLNKSKRPPTVAVSAPHGKETGGYVHVYQFIGEDWKMMGRDRDISNKDVDPTLPFDFQDDFGAFLSLVATNETYRLVVGCPQKDTDITTENSGMAVAYEYNTYDSRWVLLGAPLVSSTKSELLGQSGKFLDQGNLLVIGAPGANDDKGMIRFYRFDGTDFVAEEGAVVEGTKKYVEFGRSLDVSRRSDSSLVVAAVAASGNYTVVLEQRKKN